MERRPVPAVCVVFRVDVGAGAQQLADSDITKPRGVKRGGVGPLQQLHVGARAQQQLADVDVGGVRGLAGNACRAAVGTGVERQPADGEMELLITTPSKCTTWVRPFTNISACSTENRVSCMSGRARRACSSSPGRGPTSAGS